MSRLVTPVEVAPGASVALKEPFVHRIRAAEKVDGNPRGRVKGRPRRLAEIGDEHVGPLRDKLACRGGQRRGVAL